MKGVDVKLNEPYRSDGFIQTTVNKYAHTVAKTAFAYLKNTADAEDIMQEVFLSLMQKNPSFENEEHLKAWLIRVAINKSKNHLKSGWFKNNNPIPDELPYLSQEQSDLLSEVLALDLKYRLPIHLYYYEGYSIKEISKILGEKEATVGTRLARGRNILKKSLGGVNDE